MSVHGSCSDAEFISSFEGFELLPHIVRLIARGTPVSIDEVAAAAKLPADEVERLARSQAGTEWDDAGRLVGFGLTLRPTAHRFTVDGRAFYTWCAADTLFFTLILGQAALVESTCPATNQPIRIELTPGAVVSVAPTETVVSQRHNAELVGDIRAQVCDHGHFFSSPTAASAWASEHPDGEVLSVADAFERCHATCDEFGWLSPEAARR